jgi:hypothetical protein
MMQHVEHHHAGKVSAREWQSMGIGDHIDARETEDVGGYDVGPGILEVRGPAADIENGPLGAALEQPPVKVPIQ